MMPEKKKHIRVIIIILTAIIVPIVLSTVILYGIGAFALRNDDDKTLPEETAVDVDVDVSVPLLTREETIAALDLAALNARIDGVAVTIRFPDDSVFTITGVDAGLSHDAMRIINSVYYNGNGSGFSKDTELYILHQDGQREKVDISYSPNTLLLKALVEDITRRYNEKLENSTPLIYRNRIVLVKGAGKVSANASEIYDIVYAGLLDSLASGQPVELSYTLPEVSANKQIADLWLSITKFPRSAEYSKEIGAVTDSLIGVSFDYREAKKLIDSTETGKTVTIKFEFTYPEITRGYLESILFRDLIGEESTYVSGTANRINNVVLATQAINGCVLDPGEEFSYNRVVGMRTTERGYLPAPAFSGTETVTAVGGGVCQPSSTLYSAIKDTGLRVTERHPHSKPIAYLPWGRDATVSWGTLDFKFVNNTEYPLRIVAEVIKGVLTIRVYGTLSP